METLYIIIGSLCQADFTWCFKILLWPHSTEAEAALYIATGIFQKDQTVDCPQDNPNAPMILDQ